MQIWIETDSPTLLDELKTNNPKGVRFTSMLTGTHTDSELDVMGGETSVIKANLSADSDVIKPAIAHILSQQQSATGANFIEIDGRRYSMSSPDEVNAVVDKILQERDN